MIREIKKKSAVPVYGLAAVWLLYCLFFPLYKTWHFIVLACLSALAYTLLSFIFPGKTEYIELPKEPVRTGDEEIDALLREGETATAEMKRLSASISDADVRRKTDEIITVTENIFARLTDDRDCRVQIKRFAGYHLPTTIKLLHAYDRFSESGVEGENITGTRRKIDAVLDTILESYKKLFDSLFERQALDIETDITVLENILKREGFSGKDFL